MERIGIGAGDTLEGVLDRVRASGADRVVLDVDERAPLLLSLHHLHRLEEVAREAGAEVAIASTNSKLLNAARVFGLEVIDQREVLPASPVEPPVDEERPPSPAPSPPGGDKPEFGRGGDARMGGGGEGTPPTRALRRIIPHDDADPPGVDGGGDGPPEVVAVIRPASGRPLVRRGAPGGAWLDPYGQPYADADDAREEADDPPAPRGRPADVGEGRVRPRPVAARAAPSPAVEEDGWDDDLYDELYDDPDEPSPEPTGARPLAALAATWAGARGWFASRRGAGRDRYEDEEDDYDSAVDAGPDPADDADDDDPYPGPDDADEDRDAYGVADDGADDEDDGNRRRIVRPALRPLVTRLAPASADPVVEEEEGGWDARARPSGARVFEREELPDARPAGIAPATGRMRPIVLAPSIDDDEGDAAGLAGDEAETDGWDDAGPEPVGRAAGRPGGHSRRRGVLVGLLAGLLVAAPVVALVGYWAFAAATVTLVARTGSVATAFDVVVAEGAPDAPPGPAAQERIVVPARRITAPVSASASRPVTGARLEPDLTAGGPVVLTNPAIEPVTVPKGTVLTAADGRTYVTLDAVRVPGADPFGAGAFGTATVRVAASVRGSAGNTDAGVVRGQLPSGVYYNNRNAPIAGGSDRKIPIVSKQDLVAARAAAEAAAGAKAQAALAAATPPGGAIVPGTAEVGAFAVEFDVQEGGDADSVTATATGEATALTYALAEVEARSRAEIERRLAVAARPGEPVVPGSLMLDTPRLIEDEPGALKWRVGGSARTRAAVGSDQERTRLARRLAGQGDEEARAILQALPGVSSSSISYTPAWFPDRMPWRASAIAIRLADER